MCILCKYSMFVYFTQFELFQPVSELFDMLSGKFSLMVSQQAMASHIWKYDSSSSNLPISIQYRYHDLIILKRKRQ